MEFEFAKALYADKLGMNGIVFTRGEFALTDCQPAADDFGQGGASR
jgi:hypothetical protein